MTPMTTDLEAPTPLPHPALVLFFVGGGLITTGFAAVFLYVGTHPGPESRHGQPEAMLLGILLLAAGVWALQKGVRVWRARRPNKRLKLPARAD